MAVRARIKRVVVRSRTRIKRVAGWIDNLMTNRQFGMMVIGVCIAMLLVDCKSKFWVWARTLEAANKELVKTIQTWAPAAARFAAGSFAAVTAVELVGVAVAAIAVEALTPLDFLALGVVSLVMRRYCGNKISTTFMICLAVVVCLVQAKWIPSKWMESAPLNNVQCTIP